MTPPRLLASFALLGLGLLAHAQSWTSAYDEGLAHAGRNEWKDARDSFKAAIAYRPEDQSGPTVLPGPPTERRRWRDGAPYSPNFLAAYSAYRLGLEVVEGKTDLLKTAASELETLLNKGQSSPETVYVLNLVYARLGDSAGRDALAARVEGMKGKLDFRVDDAAVTPEDRANLAVAATPSGSPLQIPANTGTNVNNPNGSGSAQSPSLMNPGSIPIINASDLPRGKLVMPPLVGAVPRLQTKFALIVSNSESRLPNGALPFALEDARRLREALITSAGYDGANIETVTNATAANVLAVAKALAERTNDQSTVFVYYTGMGTNVDGRDYLAGVDTDMFTDTTSMIPKTALFAPFNQKGASVFAFFQVPRPIRDGRYFGSEVPEFGRIAQSQATIPGDRVTGSYRDGVLVGLYTDAIITTLADFHSNRIPITEFSWQVFYRIRRGDAAGTGGGGRQTPTLPTLLYLGADARF